MKNQTKTGQGNSLPKSNKSNKNKKTIMNLPFQFSLGKKIEHFVDLYIERGGVFNYADIIKASFDKPEEYKYDAQKLLSTICDSNLLTSLEKNKLLYEMTLKNGIIDLNNEN